MDNSLPEDLLFVPFESSLTVHVSHVEAPVTGEVNAQRNSTLPSSSRSDPMLIPSSLTVQCKETSKSKKKQDNPDKPKKKNKLDETKVKYNDTLSYDAKNFLSDEQFLIDCEDRFSNSRCENQKAEFTEGSEKVFVKGRLKRNVNFWKVIGANDFILDTIENGYKLPLIQTPEPAVFKNNKSALANPEFVTEAIQELVSTNRVLEVPFRPKVVNPLSVASNKDKNRLILDLRYVNLHLWKEETKFEDWKTFQNYLCKDGHMFKFDLKSSYHHISIYAPHQTYLGFSWVVNGETKYFVFTVLPFGLSTSPYIFTKAVRPLVKYWRFKGIPIVVFIDDGIGVGKNKEQASLFSVFVKDTLNKSGFVFNVEKSVWEPDVTAEWLGLFVNTQECFICLPKRRMVSLFNSIDSIFSSFPSITPRNLASITGKIISMTPVLGNVSRLMTRALYNAINSRTSGWDVCIDLSFFPECLAELSFWRHNLPKLNCRKLFSSNVPSIISFSDASNSACGSVISLDTQNRRPQNCHYSHRNWNTTEGSNSSTWRELKAVHFGLCSFLPLIKNKEVYWFTDNQPASHIVEKGSKKVDLHCLSLDIFSTCLQNNVNLYIKWIPRSENCLADFVSKMVDYDDWRVTDEFFAFIDSIWGPHTVDRFANSENKKLRRFNSLFWNPGCESVDAFSQNWQGENNWLVPPIHLIPKAIQHLLTCRAKGTLVVPAWPSAPFWPILFQSEYNPQHFVSEIILLEKPNKYLKVGNYKKSLIGSDKFTSPIMVVRLDSS